ncbi:hypothetical protein ALC60_11727, partial [Trachymyrmex zeteki]
AAAASRVYVDALSRLARQAQLGTWGGSKDVGNIYFANIMHNSKTLFWAFVEAEINCLLYDSYLIAVRLIVAFFGAAAQNRGLKFYGGGVDAADRVNAL